MPSIRTSAVAVWRISKALVRFVTMRDVRRTISEPEAVQ